MARRKTKSAWGTVYEDKRSGRWKVRYPAGGRTESGALKYRTMAVNSKAEGMALLAELRRAHRSGRLIETPVNDATAGTLGDAIAGYIGDRPDLRDTTLATYGYARLAMERQGITDRNVRDITPSMVTAYFNWRKVNGGCSGSARNNDLALMRSALKWACSHGWISKSPCDGFKPPRRRLGVTRPMESEHVASLLAACSPSTRTLCMVAVYSGLRAGDCIDLRWGDLRFQERMIRRRTIKRDCEVEVALNEALESHLRGVLKRRGSIPAATDYVCLSRYGRPYRRFPRTGWDAALDAAGLAEYGYGFHSLRKTFAIAAHSAGASVEDVRGMLGHRSIQTTQLYLSASAERARPAVEAIRYAPAPTRESSASV